MARASRWTAFLGLSLCLATAVCGCRVESHEGDGKSSDVKVATPFGHMNVNTDNAKVQEALGISPYPGAQPEKKDNGHADQADLNFSFGSFKLRVKAMSFLTPDAVDRVEDFYRKDLKRYGTVITCSGKRPVGQPTRTPEGLTCEEDEHSAGGKNDFSGSLELKTGSNQNQHIEGIERQDDKTKIGLVALDLPGGHFGAGNDDDGSDDTRQ